MVLSIPCMPLCTGRIYAWFVLSHDHRAVSFKSRSHFKSEIHTCQSGDPIRAFCHLGFAGYLEAATRLQRVGLEVVDW